MSEALFGVLMILSSIITAGVVGTSQYSQEEKRIAYVCVLIFYCLGTVMAEPLAAVTNPNASVLHYTLSNVVVGPIAVILFGSLWSTVYSWFDKMMKGSIKELTG